MLYVRRKRDSTSLFYDILYLALKGVSKTRIRRELGLQYHRAEELIDFLLDNQFLQGERSDVRTVRYLTTGEGYSLLYHLSVVYEKLVQFFPKRKGREFSQMGEAEVERELTEMMFCLPSIKLKHSKAVGELTTTASSIKVGSLP